MAAPHVRVESAGQINLRPADPTWHPDIDPAYFDDQRDLDATVAGYRRMIDIIGHQPFAGFLAEPWMPASRNPSDDEIHSAIRQLAQTLYHPVATCSMGNGEDAVVDAELNVRGWD